MIGSSVIDLSRRGLLAGIIGGIVCAPAIVRVSSLMKLPRPTVPEIRHFFDFGAKGEFSVIVTSVIDGGFVRVLDVEEMSGPHYELPFRNPGYVTGDLIKLSLV